MSSNIFVFVDSLSYSPLLLITTKTLNADVALNRQEHIANEI